MKRSRLLGSAMVLTMVATLTAAKCDQAQLDRACEVDPTLPFCKPSPPPPTTQPSPFPSSQPSPDSSPSAPPSPEASSPPSPSPMPSASPTTVPTPEPPDNDCIPHPLPDKPVPLVRSRPAGPGWRCDMLDGQILCAGRTAASDPQQWRTPEGDDCLRGSIYVLQSHNHQPPDAVLKKGMVYDPDRGYSDAFCRRSLDGETLLYGPEHEDNWGWSGNLPPWYCAPAPSPTPQPTPSGQPTPPPAMGDHPDVAKVLILNYGKCVIGKPFLFYLDTECKELLITATPKSADVCDGKACDSTDPSRNLKWMVTQGQKSWPIGDVDAVDIGCAVIEPGPIEMTFNRTVKGKSPCEFLLSLVFVDSRGVPHKGVTPADPQGARVQVVR